MHCFREYLKKKIMEKKKAFDIFFQFFIFLIKVVLKIF